MLTTTDSHHPFRLAVISNAVTPYRVHLLKRIANELPEVSLCSIFTHGESNAPWELEVAAEANPVFLGQGEPSAQQSKPSRQWHEWRKGGRIIRLIREREINCVLVKGYNDLGRIRVIRYCRRNRIPVLFFSDANARGDNPAGLKRLAKQVLVSWVFRHVDVFLPCGSMGKAFFQRYGAEPGRCFYFPYEPDYRLIETLPESLIADVAGRYGIDRSRRRLVYSGRLVRHKRVDLLIQAFSRIADQRPEWDLAIVGDGPLRDQLRAMVPRALEHRVIWSGFVGEQRFVTAFYKLSDVLVLPSDYEPWALVINEAAAAGLAVVASDVVGAAAELVREGVNGYTFPQGDLDSLVQKLLQTTDAANTDGLKSGSLAVLRDWRDVADPVRRLKDALETLSSIVV